MDAKKNFEFVINNFPNTQYALDSEFKIDLIDELTTKDLNDHFSKDKNCEVMTITTLEKESISKIKAKLLSYVS